VQGQGQARAEAGAGAGAGAGRGRGTDRCGGCGGVYGVVVWCGVVVATYDVAWVVCGVAWVWCGAVFGGVVWCLVVALLHFACAWLG